MFRVFFKNFLCFITTFVIILFYSNWSYSELATPSSYIVTINSMDLCEDSACANYARIGQVTKSFDIATAAAAGEVGTYVDEFFLEVGKVYTHARWNINRTFSMTGSVTISGVAGGCKTSANGTAGTETVTAYNANNQTEAALDVFIVDLLKGGDGTWPVASDYTSVGVQLVSNDFPSATTFDFIIALTSPYTVSEEVPVISMSFDVTNNLGAGFNASGSTQNGVPNNRCYYWVEDPSPSITIQ